MHDFTVFIAKNKASFTTISNEYSSIFLVLKIIVLDVCFVHITIYDYSHFLMPRFNR